jgi:predicted N-formylglutamate amidohydrolase
MSNSFGIINENGAGGTIILCCHASNHFPPEFGELGLSHEERHEHIAHDIGALELSLALSQIIDAPIVHSKVSRLVIDCNRDPTDFDAIPEVSAGIPIIGNQNLDENAKRARVHHAYNPYHNAIHQLIEGHARADELNFIAIHSFTPNYMGQKRELDIGVLIGDESGFGDKILANLQLHKHLKVTRDEPYDPNDRVYHTLNRHAKPRNLPSAMLEIRNDHLQNDENVRKFAAIIANSL